MDPFARYAGAQQTLGDRLANADERVAAASLQSAERLDLDRAVRIQDERSPEHRAAEDADCGGRVELVRVEHVEAIAQPVHGSEGAGQIRRRSQTARQTGF